ncbi:DNA N-6-adenine-methyltransferase [Pantoea septica]|uniref:DNA N-6-adenine-methyltransferase n=1 Tax=Pantoea septica TaxID=472695 RepID=UPI0035E3DAE6
MNIVNDYGGSTTPPEHRDSWQTPPEIFAVLKCDFRFVADVAASTQNHLLPVYFTKRCRCTRTNVRVPDNQRRCTR